MARLTSIGPLSEIGEGERWSFDYEDGDPRAEMFQWPAGIELVAYHFDDGGITIAPLNPELRMGDHVVAHQWVGVFGYDSVVGRIDAAGELVRDDTPPHMRPVSD
jgi:hypothetical protein